MTLRISSIGIVQTAKTIAALYALIGIIVGIGTLFVLVFNPGSVSGAPTGPVAGIIGLILIPILYAIVGFIAVAITVWFYNLVAARTGGVEFTTTQVAAVN